MAPPRFEVALVWEAKAAGEVALRCIADLYDLIPAGTAAMFVALRSEGAALHLKVDFSLYSRPFLAHLEGHTQRAGGTFVELMRIPEDRRDAFRAKFLRPVEGDPPSFESFALAGRTVRDHLMKSRAAPAPASPAPPAKPAPAPPPPAAGPARPTVQRAPRYEVLLGVEFKTKEDFVREHITNISKGGLFVRTTQRPAMSTVVRLLIHVPNGESLDTTARVVHILDHPEHGGLGLQFIPGDAAFDANLKKYLATLSGGEK